MTALSLPAPRRRPKTYAKSEATLRACGGASSGSGGSVTGSGSASPRWCASMRPSTKASSVASSRASDCPSPSGLHKDEDKDEDEERLAVKEGEEPLRLEELLEEATESGKLARDVVAFGSGPSAQLVQSQRPSGSRETVMRLFLH